MMPTAARLLRDSAGPAKRAELRRILRFGVNGAVNTVLSYVSFLLLLTLGLPGLAALLLSSGLTVAVSFFTSKRLVFRSRDRGRMPRFVALYAALIGFNAAALAAMEARGIPGWAAQACLALPIATMGYLAQRSLVFAPARDAPILADTSGREATGVNGEPGSTDRVPRRRAAV